MSFSVDLGNLDPAGGRGTAGAVRTTVVEFYDLGVEVDVAEPGPFGAVDLAELVGGGR